VLENRVLRRIFELKKEKVTDGWIKLYNMELRNFYSSKNIVRKIKSRKMRWVKQGDRLEYGSSNHL
jgi:hypothetical protein